MAIVRAVLRKEERPDGTLPLALRINKNGKVSFLYIEGYTIDPKHWDKKAQCVKKSHPNHVRLNNLILKKKSDAIDKALELENTKEHVTVRAIKNKVKPKSGDTFFKQGRAYLDDLKKSGKYNQYTADKPRIAHFKEYMGGDCSFNDVTVGCLDKYVVWLRTRRTVTKAGKENKLSERSIMNHLSAIRSVFAYAKRQDVIDGKNTPFGKGRVSIRFPDSNKEGLDATDVSKIENTVMDDERFEHCRKLWLFSFYFAGMRASDVFRLNWKDIRYGRLYYNMNKNDKGDSLKIPDKAQAILDHYKQFRQNSDDLIFPELRGVDLNNEFIVERTIAFKTSAIDKFLRKYVAPAAGVDKKLTMHIARHTFGNISGNKIPIKVLQKLYRHSHLSTTANYQQNFDHDETDNALDAVVNASLKLNK